MKFLILFLLLTGHGWASIKSYMNNNPQNSYTDPYRHIHRPGDDLEEVIVQTILSARSSVYVAVQELRLPRIAQALIDKKAEGLDVRVVLEHDYNFNVLSQRETSADNEHESSRLTELRAFVDMNGDGHFSREEMLQRDAVFMLHHHKVDVIDDTFDSSKGSGLMHHKFVVVDGTKVIVSTANFTLSCVHGDYLSPNTRGNPNSMVLVDSPEVGRIFTEEFSQLWGTGRRGNFGLSKTYRGPQTARVGKTKITVQFSPTSRRLNWQETVNGLIGQHLARAKKSVKAALFVFSDQKITNTLERAHVRGAEMSFMIEPKFAFRDYSELLDMMGLQMLNRKCEYQADNRPWKRPAQDVGIALLPRGDVLHHKFAVVDNRTVIMGSQNWSDSANYINDETLLVIEDQEISDSFTREYERLRMTKRVGPTQRLLNDIEAREEACAEAGAFF
jgi:phosphatidylserine/phosphatidylglycerophosphate/cardiolipin synthase-like enzyme